jgi:hypothetical protein
MAIITISRGKFSGATRLAECVAEKLGYRCLTRMNLIKAATQYGASEEKLSEAIAEAPHFWERLSSERARHMACLRSTLLSEVKEGNIVWTCRPFSSHGSPPGAQGAGRCQYGVPDKIRDGS